MDKLIVVRLDAQTGAYRRELAAAAASTASFSSVAQTSAAQAAGSISQLGVVSARAGKFVTLGVAAGLALSAKAAIDFESSFTGIRKTVDTSEAGFQKLADGIRAMSREIPISVNELNKIGELGGQLGVPAEDLEEFIQVIAELGVTTDLSVEQAAQSIARLSEILNIPTSDARGLGSVLVDLGNNFATTESQILDFALRIAPVGQIVGLTGDEVLGLGAAFSSVGVPAERGGTAVQNAFVKIAAAVADGGDELEAFADVAGLTVDEFSTLFEQDAATAFQRFIEGLNLIEQDGGNVFALLDDLGLAGVRTQQSLLALASAGDLLGRSLDTAGTAIEENNALTIEAEKRFATTASQIELAKNRIKDLGIAIGTAVLPIVVNFLEAVSTLAEFFQRLGPAGKTATSTILLTSSAMFLASKAGGLLSKVVGTDVVAGFAKATGASTAFQTSLARLALGSGILAGLVAITAVVGHFISANVDAKIRIDELVDSLEEERKGIEGVTVALLQRRLVDEGQIDLLNRLNIGSETFAKALLGEAESLELVEEKIDKAREAAQKFAEANQNQEGDISVFLDPAIEQTVLDVVAAQDLLGNITREVNQAFEEQAAIIESERLDRLAADSGQLAEQMDRVKTASERAGDAIREPGKAADFSAKQLEEMSDALRELVEEELSARDASLGAVNAIIGLVEARQALDAAEGKTVQNQIALQEAYINVRNALASLGPDGIQPAIRNLEEMLLVGAITREEFTELLNLLNLFVPVANNMAGGSGVIIGSMGGIQRAAQELNVPIQVIINQILGLNAAMEGTVANIGAFQAALNLVSTSPGRANVVARGFLPEEDALAASGGATAAQVAQIQRIFGDARQDFVDVGVAVAQAIGSGISSGGGGGGGSSPVEEAVVDLIEEARKAAEQAVDGIIGAISTAINAVQAVEDLEEAETKLADLRREQLQLPLELAAAEIELANARAEAAAVTLDEQLAIEQAQEDLERAQLAFAQGRITETELLIAERDLAEAIENSTAATDEVLTLEEELIEMRARGAEITDEITDAARDLELAQLALVGAQLQLIQAGRDFIESGPEGIDLFLQIGAAAGIAEDALEDLIVKYGELSVAALGGAPAALGPSSSATGSSTGGSITVQSGDTLNAIASSLGVTLGELLAVNPQITNPDLIHPGDIITTPGSPSTSSGVVAFNATSGSTSTSSSVTIDNITISGIWDFTNPSQIEDIVDLLEEELANRTFGKV